MLQVHSWSVIEATLPHTSSHHTNSNILFNSYLKADVNILFTMDLLQGDSTDSGVLYIHIVMEEFEIEQAFALRFFHYNLIE